MSQLLRGTPKIYVLGEEAYYPVFFYHPAVKRVKTVEDMVRDIEER